MQIVRVSDVRRWVFCPRMVWHRNVLGPIARETPRMHVGRQAEAALAQLEKRRSWRRFGLEAAARRFSVPLEDRAWGVVGLCDLVLETPAREEPWPLCNGEMPDGIVPVMRRQPGRSIPVEIKTTRGGVTRAHVLQLTGYAMLLERAGAPPVEHGFVILLPADEVVAVRIGPKERKAFERAVEEVRAALQAPALPQPTRFRSFCQECEFLNFCGDVL